MPDPFDNPRVQSRLLEGWVLARIGEGERPWRLVPPDYEVPPGTPRYALSEKGKKDAVAIIARYN